MRLFQPRSMPFCDQCRDKPRHWPRSHCHACGNGLSNRTTFDETCITYGHEPNPADPRECVRCGYRRSAGSVRP